MTLAELDPAERLALTYARRDDRYRYWDTFRLDVALRQVALKPRELSLTQIRFAWWRQQVDLIGNGGLPPHPLLGDLAPRWHARANRLAAMVDAWEEAALSESFVSAAEEVACARAGMMGGLRVEAATRVWTLVDLARYAPDAPARSAMLGEAAAAVMPRLSREDRPLAVLAGLAQRSARKGHAELLGDRGSPLVAIALGMFGRLGFPGR